MVVLKLDRFVCEISGITFYSFLNRITLLVQPYLEFFHSIIAVLDQHKLIPNKEL